MNSSIQSINIAHLNIRSISNKYHLINSLIVNNNIHIMCLNETWLDDKTSYIDLPTNYCILRNDRKFKKGGGVAIIYNSMLELSASNLNYSETIITTVCSKNSNCSFKLIISYVEPKCTSKFEFIEEELASHNSNTLIMGDFNAKHSTWFNNINNKKGDSLAKIVDKFNLNIINDCSPTTFNSDSIIDLVISTADLASDSLNFRLLKNKISDHKAILINQRFALKKTIIPIQLKTKTNWDTFRNKLVPIFNKMSNEEISNLDNYCTEFTSAITSSHEASTPRINVNPNRQARYTIPKPILELKKQKNKYRQLYQKTRAHIYKNLYNNANNRLKRKITELKSINWNNLCRLETDNGSNSSSMWKKIRKLDTADNQKPNLLPGVDKTDSVKSEIFADHFKKVFSNTNLSAHSDSTIKLLEEASTTDTLTQAEVATAIKSINKKSCPGLDFNTGNMISNLPPSGLAVLLKIFNYSFINCRLPQLWKNSKIILLPKKDSDLDKPSSYRPISLTSCLVKLLEKIISARLRNFVDSNSILSKYQSGFRALRSTHDNILRITHDIKSSFNKNKKTCLVLFDVEKAFDKACHVKLIEALLKHKIPNHLIKWIREFLNNRKFTVQVGNHTSTLNEITAGTPQGSISSPLLFSLFINDIVVTATDSPVKIALFADDIAIWFSHINKRVIQSNIQLIINCIHNYCYENNLKLNVKKTSYTLFAKNGYRRDYLRNSTLELSIDNESIERVLNPRLLGITLDPSLNFKEHFRIMLYKCQKSTNLIRILSHHSKGINRANLTKVYNAYIRSLLIYSFIPFTMTSNNIKDEIQIMQNNNLRTITKLSKLTYTKIVNLHKLCNIPLVKDIIQKTLDSYMSKILTNSSLYEILEPRYSEAINTAQPKFFSAFNYTNIQLT